MPIIVEGGLTIGRELGLAYLTGGLSGLSTPARLGLRLALTAREVYQGSVNFAIAYDKLNAGDGWGAGWHALLGTINVVGAFAGAKGVADDLIKLSRPVFQGSKVGGFIKWAEQSAAVKAPSVASRLGAVLDDYSSFAGTVSIEEAKAIARAHGFSLEIGRASRFERARGVVIGSKDLQNGGVNRVLLAEEIQHGLDRATHAASRALRRGLTNEEFHVELFRRVLAGHKKGIFSFLTTDDLLGLQKVIGILGG